MQRNLAEERDFLDDTEAAATSDALRIALGRVPSDRAAVPGLQNPNERLEKGLFKTLAYQVLGNEGIVSRNIAKRGSSKW